MFWGLLQTRDERWCGQMSKVLSVRPDKLQLGYRLLLWAWGRAGAKTMPTPLCDDQCLRRLCKMAAAKPTHYYESLARQFFFFFFSQRKCHLWVTVGPQSFILNAVNKSAIFAFWGSRCLHITTSKAVCCHEILSAVWSISPLIPIYLVESMLSYKHHSNSGTK